MDDLFWNKVFAGILIALIVVQAGRLLSGYFIHSTDLEKPAFLIDTSALQAANLSVDKDSGPEDLTPYLLRGDLSNGEKVFKKCLQCHTPYKGGAHKIGPNLWDIILNTFAHAKDFAYSSAFKELKDKKWTFDALNQFLYKPKKYVPGTKMSFVGIKDNQDRADVILYMRSQSDKPVKLPDLK